MKKKTLVIVVIAVVLIIAAGMLVKKSANRQNIANQNQLTPSTSPSISDSLDKENSPPPTQLPTANQQSTANSGELESVFGGISDPDTNSDATGLGVEGMI